MNARIKVRGVQVSDYAVVFWLWVAYIHDDGDVRGGRVCATWEGALAHASHLAALVDEPSA